MRKGFQSAAAQPEAATGEDRLEPGRGAARSRAARRRLSGWQVESPAAGSGSSGLLVQLLRLGGNGELPLRCVPDEEEEEEDRALQDLRTGPPPAGPSPSLCTR